MVRAASPSAASVDLAVFAHPDDESWAAGGLIARRGDVHVVTFTAGEAGFGEVARRPAELAAACAELGATCEIVGLPDGRVTVPAVVDALTPILARHAPTEIIGFDLAGGYGHIDHVAIVRGTLAAITTLPQRPTLLGAVFPAGLLEPLRDRIVPAPSRLHPPRRHTRAARRRAPISSWTSPRPRRQPNAAPWLCHASQLATRRVDHFLGRGIFAALATVERYRRVAD